MGGCLLLQSIQDEAVPPVHAVKDPDGNNWFLDADLLMNGPYFHGKLTKV